jgi:hypothetical protein
MYEYDQFKGNIKQYLTSRDQLENALSEEILFKSFVIFHKTKWAIRFHNKFLQRFK